MVESSVLSWSLYAGFSLTAVHGLLLCARAWTAPADVTGPDGKAVAFGHLTMSLAMIAMVPMWGGSSAHDLQLILFGCLCGYLLLRASGVLRFGGAQEPDRRSLGYHALMAGSMVWMVAAMTTMTGHVWAEAAGGHEGHGAGGSSAAHAEVDAPLWTVVVTLGLVGVLAASTLIWSAAARRPERVPVLVGSGAPAHEVESGADAAVRSPEERRSGVSHALMSLGMITMLLVMIW